MSKDISKQFTFGMIVLVACTISFIVLTLFSHRYRTAVIQIGEKKMYVQVATTIGQQHRGLGGRDDMLPYAGMVFPYHPPRRAAMVMRDMHFPIDIIWIRSGRVVDIAPEVAPEPGVPEDQLRIYYPRAEADMVVEVAAGFTTTYGIRIGDPVQVIDE